MSLAQTAWVSNDTNGGVDWPLIPNLDSDFNFSPLFLQMLKNVLEPVKILKYTRNII